MRREGIEPSRTNVLRILSPVRLPIPPSALNSHLIPLSRVRLLNPRKTKQPQTVKDTLPLK